MNYKNIEVIDRDIKAIREFKATAPTLNTFTKPDLPSAKQILASKGPEICGIPSNLFSDYMNIAMNSEDAAIQHKLRELIAIVKLITPYDDPALEISMRHNAMYDDKMRTWENNTNVAQERYDNEYKNFNLQLLKKQQDLAFYCEDLVDAAWARHKENRATFWDKLVFQVICDEFQVTEIREQEIISFKEMNASGKASVIKEAGENHYEFIREEYNRLVEDELASEDFSRKMVHMEAEMLIQYPSEGSSSDDDALNEYDFCNVMQEYESELRCIAEETALHEIQRRYYQGIDGYDHIYGYESPWRFHP